MVYSLPGHDSRYVHESIHLALDVPQPNKGAKIFQTRYASLIHFVELRFVVQVGFWGSAQSIVAVAVVAVAIIIITIIIIDVISWAAASLSSRWAESISPALVVAIS